MCKKLICFVSFVLVLGLASTGSAGLEGYWPLDDDLLDVSGNGHHGSWMGDPNAVVDPNAFEPGAVGLGLAFDGVDDYVNIDGYKGINAIDGVQQEFSVANWFRIAPGAADGNVEMVTWGTSASRQRLTWRIHQGRLRTEHASGNLRGNTYVDDDEWHHGALVVTEGANLRVPATRMYVDGVEDTIFSGSNNPYELTAGADVRIGMSGPQNGRYWPGSLDEVYIFSRVLDANQVTQVMNGIVPEWPNAGKPSPADDAMLEDISVFLSWRPGTTAVSHDVYFGTTPDLGPDQLASQQVESEYLATGLETDQTYYWRIDEVAADETISTGDVWSFWTPPKRAYDPEPEDGMINVDTEADLSWTGGWSPILHSVYFGTDPDIVANETGAPMSMDIGFDPNSLEPDTTYYWRVDEFYGTETVAGPVWTFSTIPEIPLTDDPNLVAWYTLDESAGKTAIDWSGHNGHGKLVGDVQWAEGIDGGALEFDGSGGDFVEALGCPGVTGTNSRTLTAWIKTTELGEIASWGQDSAGLKWIFRVQESNGTIGAIRIEVNGGYQVGSIDVRDGQWHHVAAVLVDDGSPDVNEISLYVDGFLEAISAQLDEPINTAADGYVCIGQSPWGTRPFNGLIDDVRVYDKVFTRDEMRQTFGNMLLAWDPQPAYGTVADIWSIVELAWTPGDGAAEHDVYLGTDPNAVAAADATDAAGIYRGRQAEAAYAPEVLNFEQNYYWRIDEVGADGTISTGIIWSFTTTGELVIYDVETPFPYDNSVEPFLSEIALDFDPALNLTLPISRIAISYTGQAAPGSVAVNDVNGTTTVIGRGSDIWGTADQFQYAHTTLTGNGSMIVKVESLLSTDDWTKAGIMIRETLDPNSAFAAVYATGVNGVRFQARAMPGADATSDSSVATDEQMALIAPVWLKIERMFPMVSAFYSLDGVTWTPMSWNPQIIPLSSPVTPIYIGLVVTSHSGDSTYAEAVFSGISSDGDVIPGQLTSTEIGLVSNTAEPMYLVLADASGATAAVLNPDPAALQQASATDWIVELADLGIDRTAVTSATLVIGNLDNPTPGSAGMLTINNVRLLPPLIAVGPIDSMEIDVDPDAPETAIAVLSINGIDVNDLTLGTTSSDFEKYEDHPAADADNFDLTIYASLDDSTVVKTAFDVPVTTIFILERGADDSGYIQALDANGEPVGDMVSFTPDNFLDTGYEFAGQKGGAMVITAQAPIYGIQILPPDDGALGIDPVSVSAIAVVEE